MELQIYNQEHKYQLRGTLNKLNVSRFRKEFANVFERYPDLTLNIEELTSIDRYGVNAIAQLHNEALVKGKKLSIIGMGSDDLYEHFKSDHTAA